VTPDLRPHIASALRAADPEWTASDTEQGIRALRTRLRRRRVGARVVAGALVAMISTSAVWLYLRGSGPASVEAASVTGTPLLFADGSKVVSLDESTVISVEDARPERIVAVLARGRARFEVTRNPGRVFRAVAGAVSVEALGTAFVVEHRGGLVGVSVQHGRVRVTWPDGSRELGVADTGWFPPPDAVRHDAVQPESAFPAAVPSAPGSSDGPSQKGSSRDGTLANSPDDGVPAWEKLAAAGDHVGAYRMLRAAGGRVNGADELLLAADVARLSGHPAEAATYLERFLREHDGDGRAETAAFSLGHLLMTRLGQPAAAARRFAEARRRTRGGSIDEDALAREVEAWSRAGDLTRARDRAEDYLKNYPGGRRSAAVRKFGGLD
jgi:transmembrane sensor